MSSLLAGVVNTLESALRFRVARQGVLAGNVTNADTPGYRRVDLKFSEALDSASQSLSRTHARHLHAGGGANASHRVEIGPRGTRPDGNGVELQDELIQLSRNSGAFEDQATVLARVLALRRRAVAGQPS